MIRALLAAALLLLAALPAQAADKKKEDASVSREVDLVPVAVPVVVGGQVRNYVFVTVRVTAAASADPNEIRQAEPLLRDAIVRTAHRTSMTRPDNYNLVDAKRLVAALNGQFPALVGKGKISTISISKQQPKNVLHLPKRPA